MCGVQFGHCGGNGTGSPARAIVLTKSKALITIIFRILNFLLVELNVKDQKPQILVVLGYRHSIVCYNALDRLFHSNDNENFEHW